MNIQRDVNYPCGLKNRIMILSFFRKHFVLRNFNLSLRLIGWGKYGTLYLTVIIAEELQFFFKNVFPEKILNFFFMK